MVSYSNEVDKYEVQWLKNGKTKLVTRVNLRFKLEDEDIFNDRLAVAEFYRKRSEVYMYLFML